MLAAQHGSAAVSTATSWTSLPTPPHVGILTCHVTTSRSAAFFPPQAALNGYQLDKAHKFAATLFDEFDRLSKVPEEYAEPEERTFTPGDNLLVGAGGWLLGAGWV